MSIYRTILVDDESIALDQLEGKLQAFPQMDVISRQTDPVRAEQLIRRENPELVFLDIEMPRKNGLELAKEIKKYNPDTVIIFVTSYNKYAIQAIKQAAFDYILKPVNQEELGQSLNRLLTEKNAEVDIETTIQNRYSLTAREAEVTGLIRLGLSTEEIADKLCLSKLTINTHRQNILRKCGCWNFAELFGRFSR